MVPPGKSWWHIGEEPLSVHWNYWTSNHGLHILKVRLWILVNVKMHSTFNHPPKIRAINCFSRHIRKRATTKALILVIAWQLSLAHFYGWILISITPNFLKNITLSKFAISGNFMCTSLILVSLNSCQFTQKKTADAFVLFSSFYSQWGHYRVNNMI